MVVAGWKRKRGTDDTVHPYLSGNFAPIQQTLPLTPCSYTGRIPPELAGGEYVRNGGNPVTNSDLGRDAHWFDGDGMLSGVAFTRTGVEKGNRVQPEFVNQFILTDLYLSSIGTPSLQTPILPSIATLVNPAASMLLVIWHVLRTVFLTILSHLVGSAQAIKKISVANTSIYYHDGRALAGCESGPPMRVALPRLETVGWFNGIDAEGEPRQDQHKAHEKLGGNGLIGFMKEWTTAHPKIDERTSEMMVFNSNFVPPYVHYSIIPASGEKASSGSRITNVPVPGISSAKMMHDFGVSRGHTVIMDLPLSLDPLNMAKNRPVVGYDPTKSARFGVFPRRDPSQVRWFETSACCIFHAANCWDKVDATGRTTAVNLLVCRLTSATLVFSAGNLPAPQTFRRKLMRSRRSVPFFEKYDKDFVAAEGQSTAVAVFDEDLESPFYERQPMVHASTKITSPDHASNEQPAAASLMDLEDIEEQCRLYHYSFSLDDPHKNFVSHQFALSAIPFEFPSLRPSVEMEEATFVYGCTTTVSTSFGAALGKAAKIDGLVKINAAELIRRGESGLWSSETGCVDGRSVEQIQTSQDPNDPISIFSLPQGWFAQEPRFVPRADDEHEDDGYLLAYVFNESQLGPDGECLPHAKSELWIIDAKNMRDVVCKIHLPQRVPYGLHGNWFSEQQIKGQRAIQSVRSVDGATAKAAGQGEFAGGCFGWKSWMAVRHWVERLLA